MDLLKQCRTDIDKVNSRIIELLAEREKLVREIGEYKRQNGLGVVDSKREKEMYNQLGEEAREYGLSGDYVEGVFRLIVNHSREIENGRNS